MKPKDELRLRNLPRYIIGGADFHLWRDDKPDLTAHQPVTNETYVKWSDLEPAIRLAEAELRRAEAIAEMNVKALAAAPAPPPQEHWCAGCGHRWKDELAGAELCGDCWRRSWRTAKGELIPAPPPQEPADRERRLRLCRQRLKTYAPSVEDEGIINEPPVMRYYREDVAFLLNELAAAPAPPPQEPKS